MQNPIDLVLGAVAPGLAVERARNRMALAALQQTTMRYDAAQPSQAHLFRATRGDADTAGSARSRLAAIARDVIRNTGFARRGMDVIAANVVGDGIIPRAIGGTEKARKAMLAAIEAHCDTTRIDAEGRATLYGLQHQAANAVVSDGEVLLRRRRRDTSDGLPLPFQLQLMEVDYLDSARDGVLKGGNQVRGGVEFDLIGRVVAYWLFDTHPGATGWRLARMESRRIPASEIAHVFRVDRPGQTRGVSWFAPIDLRLQNLHDHDNAQLLRQKIAACFAAFVTGTNEGDAAAQIASLQTLMPGRIEVLQGENADVKFATPPGVEGYDEFQRWGYRAVAAALGITYEALTGDLTGVNFTSYKAGRIEMNNNVSGWQWRMMVPMFCDPVGNWMLEGFGMQFPTLALPDRKTREFMRLAWVPPKPQMIDPNREIPALVAKVRAGFASRPQVISEMGYDAERITADLAADADVLDTLKLIFDTDARRVSGAGVTQARPAGSTLPEDGGGLNNE